MNITKQLKEPFNPKAIHWRVGATTKDKDKGIALAYLNARDVMKRFDDVCGDLWQVEYPFDGCCRIGVKIGDEWVWRSNGAGETQVEGEKGKFSDAFKRAAVLWGVGRYLYYLENVWCPLTPKGRSYVITSPPKLPDWALPGTRPEIADFTPEQKSTLDALIADSDSVGMYVFSRSFTLNDASSKSASVWISLMHSFQKGEKGKYGTLINTLKREGMEIVDSYVEEISGYLHGGDDGAVTELANELNEETLNLIDSEFTHELSMAFNKLR